MNSQKRVVAIHDISCFGRCSLTVALPIISATGIEVTALPTAILSTHTGGISGYTFKDLTSDMLPIVEHWKTLNLEFDGIYTGYLGSFEQIEIIKEIFRQLKSENTFIYVDPVMADNGKLYPLFPSDFPKGMRTVCEQADMIIPNITEAVLMLEEEYVEGPYTKEYIEGLLRRLSKELNVNQVVLTGVYFDEENLGAAGYDAQDDSVVYAFSKRLEGYFHGTGDVFGSALLSAILNKVPLQQALQIAVDFTTSSIQRTKDAKADIRFGVNFEAGLQELSEKVK